MRADEVINALNARYSDTRRYARAYEVGLTTGGSRRRLDMVVLDCYASNGFRIDGIEVKVSKADLKRELENPDKHTCFFDLIDYFTLACPEGIADLSVIPPKWGVLLVKADGSTRYKRRPIALHDEVRKTVPRGFFAEMTRAIQGREPATRALRAEYERGLAEAEERHARHRKYVHDRIEKEGAKLEAYDKLERRLHAYGDDMESKLDFYERMADSYVDFLPGKLRSWANQMQMMADKMDGD